MIAKWGTNRVTVAIWQMKYEKRRQQTVFQPVPLHIPQCGMIVKENLEMSFKNSAVL
jgi:hypothetical protein